eukprot:7166772-Prymnesium_polylepis.1
MRTQQRLINPALVPGVGRPQPPPDCHDCLIALIGLIALVVLWVDDEPGDLRQKEAERFENDEAPMSVSADIT